MTALAASPAALLPLVVLVAAALDAVFAEPPGRVHPVALFGRLVAPFDRAWSRPRAVGALATLVLPLGFAGVAAGAVLASGRLAADAGLAGASGVAGHDAVTAAPRVAAGVAALALFSTASLRMLLAAGRTVVAASESDVSRARAELPALAGRDPSSLSPEQLRSAAVESLAENLADGLVAPLFGVLAGAAVGLAVAPADPVVALALAAGGAAWVKGVNTLDSMLGYASKPVGWAPARLDDLVMWLPARASALALALAAADPGALSRARADARVPASPNSGWPMATLASALGVRLEKPGAYVLNGAAADPTVADGRRAVRLVRRAGVASVLAAAAALAGLGVAAAGLPGVSA